MKLFTHHMSMYFESVYKLKGLELIVDQIYVVSDFCVGCECFPSCMVQCILFIQFFNITTFIINVCRTFIINISF